LNLEEKLQRAKQFEHHKIQVDMDKFEARLFQRLAQEDNPKRKSLKWKAVSFVAAVIVIPSAAYAGNMLDVHKDMVHHMQDGTKMPQNSPKFSNDKVQKAYSLSEARAASEFLIREPETIGGWKHDVSQGMILKHLENSKTSGVDQYMDVYSNSKGQQISVTQSGNFDTGQYETETKFDENGIYSSLIADKEGKMKTLMIIIKEKNNTITYLQIMGDASEADFLYIGEAYIQAPTN